MREPSPGNQHLDANRWRSLCAALGFAFDEETYRALVQAYAEPHRFYHTDEHLNYCLCWLDAARACAEQPEFVETALWFHDAIYRIGQRDNEHLSARWAQSWIRDHGGRQEDAEYVGACILVTAHPSSPRNIDQRLVADIDLAILGASELQFDRYEDGIRQEYRWVPDFLFNHRRAELLKGLLHKPRIYATDFFHEQLEEQARKNIARSLLFLEA